MDFAVNFPFFSIILCLICSVLSSVLKRKVASILTYALLAVTFVLNACVTAKTFIDGTFFTYKMGHYPAPWGNELRAGSLEGLLASFFCIIIFIALLGGKEFLEREIEESKQNLYYTMLDLLLCSVFALIYTNDLFTAYVFIEINTISACGLIMIKNSGHAIVATTKYMIMSLVGSGLFLLGVILLYDVTGHLLMSNIKESVTMLYATGQYNEPLTIIIGLIAVGLAIKSALYPFHSWLPDAHGYSTASSTAVLSSVVLKAFFILLVKVCIRVIGWDVITNAKILDVLFVFGMVSMVMGSIKAIGEHHIKRMIVYSSIAQIGYLYMGLGIGNIEGVTASMFHILTHASSKAMLFVAVYGLAEASGGSLEFEDIKGAGHRNVFAGVAFTVGAFSLIGVPLFAGFISKLLFASSAVATGSDFRMVLTLLVLAFSTILNTIYFFRAIIKIYSPNDIYEESGVVKEETTKWNTTGKRFAVAMVLFILVNVCLNVFSANILEIIKRGISMLA